MKFTFVINIPLHFQNLKQPTSDFKKDFQKETE